MARISLWQQRVQVTVLRCSEGTLPPQPGPDHADPGTLDNVLDVCPPLLFIEELVHLVEFKTHYWISKLKTQTSSNSTPWLKTTPNYRLEKIALMKIVMCFLSVTLGKHPMGWSFLFLWSHACAVHRHGQRFSSLLNSLLLATSSAAVCLSRCHQCPHSCLSAFIHFLLGVDRKHFLKNISKNFSHTYYFPTTISSPPSSSPRSPAAQPLPQIPFSFFLKEYFHLE